MKTLKERVSDPSASTVRLPGSKFQLHKKIIKEGGQAVEVEEIMFEFKVSELIPLLKSMANSHGFVHGRISPMRQPTENLTHIGLLVITPKNNTEDAH